MIEIPLNSSPEQKFKIQIDNIVFDIRVVLNSRLSKWSISIGKNGEDILNGLALVGGVNILNQFNIELDNMYLVNLDNHRNDPSKSNLGTISKLFILSESEVSNA